MQYNCQEGEAVASAFPVTDEAAGGQASVRVPNKLIGALLDKGKDSAYGLHLLAIKASKPCGWTLNHIYCKKHGISSRGFKAGLKLLRSEIGLERSQPAGRKGYAVESDPIGLVQSNYTSIPQHLLALDSKVLALGIAGLSGPKPVKAALLAKRLGIRSPKTASHLAKAAKKAGIVEIYQGVRGEMWVGRGGINFAEFLHLGKNDLAKNDLAKNDPTHKKTEGDKEYRTGSSSETVNPSARVLKTARRRGSSFKDETTPQDNLAALRFKSARDKIRFDELILPDWKVGGSFKFPDLPEGEFYGQSMDRKNFDAWVRASGGLPSHLTSIHAFRQMDEIATMLATSYLPNGHRLGRDRDGYQCLDSFDALVGVIIAVCKEDAERAQKGRTLKNLHYVAGQLFQKTRKHDFSWALNRSVLADGISKEAFDDASYLGSDAYRELGRRNFPMVKDTMLSTYSIEHLAKMIQTLGRATVVAALNEFIKCDDLSTSIEGARAKNFSWFEDVVSQHQATQIAERELQRENAARQRRNSRQKKSNSVSL